VEGASGREGDEESVAQGSQVHCRGQEARRNELRDLSRPGREGQRPAAAALPPPKPADWTSAKVKSEPDGDIFWKISNGRGAMPPWKHLPDKDRWALVNYIRSLQK